MIELALTLEVDGVPLGRDPFVLSVNEERAFPFAITLPNTLGALKSLSTAFATLDLGTITFAIFRPTIAISIRPNSLNNAEMDISAGGVFIYGPYQGVAGNIIQIATFGAGILYGVVAGHR